MEFANPVNATVTGMAAATPLSLVDRAVGVNGTLELGPFDVSGYQILGLYFAQSVGVGTITVALQWQSLVGAGSGQPISTATGGTGIPIARRSIIVGNGKEAFYECPNYGPRLSVVIYQTPAGLWQGPLNLQARNGVLGGVPFSAAGKGSMLAEVSQVLGAGAAVLQLSTLVASGWAMLRIDQSGAGNAEAQVGVMKEDGTLGGLAAVSTLAAFSESKLIQLPPQQTALNVVNRGGVQPVYASLTMI